MRLELAGLPTAVWRGVVDFVTPPVCLACRTPVSEAASLCADCWLKLVHIEAPVCQALGTPFAYDEGEGALSPAAIAEPPAWSRARGAVAYDDASRPLVQRLKFHDGHEAGLLMARMMARAGRQLLAEADLVMPVPLHRWRLWRRRFNQAGFLAKRLAATAGKPYRPDILLRARATPPQVGLDADQRRKNLRGAFTVDPERGAALLAGKRVLLVDDVLTTGATATACSQALRKAGAAEVDVLCFALVLVPKRIHI